MTTKPKKIAIVGSAPSSIGLAPFEDRDWDIWGCSPAAANQVRRASVWFEIHRWGQNWLTDSYKDFLRKVPYVYTIEPVAELPNSIAFPKQEMIDKFGRNFFTSTPAWMLALAISEMPEEIGIYGIDMATHSEYAHQKPGCLYFIEQARAKGIKVTIPKESDLLQPFPLYGFCEMDPQLVKLQAREAELQNRINNHAATIDTLIKESEFLKGALDDLRYVMNTWAV